jgi:hypothetical protein
MQPQLHAVHAFFHFLPESLVHQNHTSSWSALLVWTRKNTYSIHWEQYSWFCTLETLHPLSDREYAPACHLRMFVFSVQNASPITSWCTQRSLRRLRVVIAPVREFRTGSSTTPR